MAVKAMSRYSGDLLFNLQAPLLLQVEDFMFLRRSVKREQQKQGFRIFNLALMNSVDCQSKETTSKDISFEAEGNESLNYGNGSESESRSVVSYSLQPHRLYSSWNSPGQNTGVGSLPLLQVMAVGIGKERTLRRKTP